MLSGGHRAEQALTFGPSCPTAVGCSCPTAVGNLQARESYLFAQGSTKTDTWCRCKPADRAPRSRCGRFWCYLRCAASPQWSAVHEHQQPRHSRRRWRHWRNTPLLLWWQNKQRRSYCCRWQAHPPTRTMSSLAMLTLAHCKPHHLLGARCCKHGGCCRKAGRAAAVAPVVPKRGGPASREDSTKRRATGTRSSFNNWSHRASTSRTVEN